MLYAYKEALAEGNQDAGSQVRSAIKSTQDTRRINGEHCSVRRV
jgi:hypothetical protein